MSARKQNGGPSPGPPAHPSPSIRGSAVIGYTRVSTDAQWESGLGLSVQEARIRARAETESWGALEIIQEIASGKDLDGRPLLEAALARLENPDDPAATLVSTSLDRVSRSTIDFATLLERARANGWSLVLLDLGLDSSTPMGAFVAQIVAAVAELERKLIAERTSAALRARYRVTPRSRALDRAEGEERERILAAYERIRELRAEGKTYRGIAARLNEDKVASIAGARWHDNSVRRALREAQAVLPPPRGDREIDVERAAAEAHDEWMRERGPQAAGEAA